MSRRVRGIRTSIPPGYIVGRKASASGNTKAGAAELIPISQMASVSYVNGITPVPDGSTITAVGNVWSSAGGGISPGTPPTIVQTKLFEGASASITLDSAPTNGNLLVAMFFNPTVGTVGAGWTLVASNSTGTDFGVIATKVAGAGESATQSPLSGSATGIIAMWEIHNQNTTPVIVAQTQAEQSGLQSNSPSVPNIVNAITLGCVSLVSTSNSILKLYNMTQDQIINTGTTRQAVMGHSNASVPVGQPLVTFTGTGSPNNKSGVIIITT